MTRTEDCNRKFLFDGVTGLLFSPEVKPEAKEKIELVAEFLKENPEYGFILYFNHISFNDPAVLVHAANLINPDSSRKLLIPASYSHIKDKNFLGKLANFGKSVFEGCGIEVLPVIQSYQINNPKYGFTESEAKDTYSNFIRRLKELKTANTPVGVLISPEGHRSETGGLIEAGSGMVAAGRLLAPVIYVPLALEYKKGKYNRDGINIGRKMTVNIGDVTVQENPKDYPTVEDLMKKLAGALPEEMRGIWK